MLLNIDKPAGMTSHDVVDVLRKITGERRVGHAGTLDPFATGVLVVGVTRASTKRLATICKETDKEYEATLLLGKRSTTGDPDGTLEVTATPEKVRKFSEGQITTTLKAFTGEVEQTPPAYSAIKIMGKPAYTFARRGEKVDLPQRKVMIHSITVLDIRLPELNLLITCSSGTYIRSLAQDIGAALGVGAYLTKLKRTRVGDFTLAQSYSLEELKKKAS